ncbi:MAG: class II aldolase/adducin family protein [Phycisphaerae bacterium]|jgi:L-fuculose-phosphate aldolase
MANEFKIKQQICDVGRRLYAKGFAAANDGNISYRVGENEVLCSPTMTSKGDLKPEDICKVDLTGRQLAGARKRTSEVLLHLEIYKLDPAVKAVVHCHPPHATAFAVAGEPIPTCILPEVEVFLGPIPTTVYETPGGQAFADTIKPFVKNSRVAVLRNHGTVSWGDTLEHAYWWTEILDAYCRILLLAKQIGRVDRISVPKVDELLDLKERFGMGVDPRRLENADLCVNTEFGRGYADGPGSCGCGSKSNGSAGGPGPSEAEMERIVQEITDRIMAASGA